MAGAQALFIWKKKKKKDSSSSFYFFTSVDCVPWNGPKGSQTPPKKRFSHGWAEPRLPQLSSTGHTHPHLILILSDLILKHLSPQLISFGLWQRERETNLKEENVQHRHPSQSIHIPRLIQFEPRPKSQEMGRKRKRV